MKVLKDLLYSKEHEWVKVEGNRAYIGITDFAQHALGDIVFVELPEIDDEFNVGDQFGVVESVKAASDIYIPVDGKIIEINEEVVDGPELVNQDPYKNWLIHVEISDPSQVESLMGPEEYEEFCNGEE